MLLDPDIPASLAAPSAYPADPSASAGIEEIQTHISHVFLTGERVYKVKKSVDLGFVSFASRAARNRDCAREVVLNRRLAPDVYLGVAPIERRNGGFAVGPIDPQPDVERYERSDGEHCVVMRRLAAGRDAQTLLEADALPAAWLEAAADRLAAFHDTHGLGRPAPFSEDEWRSRIWRPVEANFEVVEANRIPPLQPAEIRSLRDLATAAFERLAPTFETRRLAGRAVDGHGDLHLQHFWFEGEDGAPLVIDCLEFSDELRQVDAASEVAFLAMDLAYRGRADLAERWLARYASAMDDYGLYRVVDFFVAYRAAVRAKVEAIEAGDPEIPEAQRDQSAREAARRIRFAEGALSPRPVGTVYLVGGLIGSGKSTLARALSRRSGAPIVSSDALRRRDPISQAQETDPDAWQEGRYAPAATARIYDEMLTRAEAVVTSGRPVVLDASWSRAEQRAAVRAWATALGAPTLFLEARCNRDASLARLEKRRLAGRDASEAGPEIYDDFARSFDPVGDEEWPKSLHHVVQTDRAHWQEELELPVPSA